MNRSRHALTQAELNDYKANGLIAKNIESLAWKIKEYSNNPSDNNTADFLKYIATLGIHSAFFPFNSEGDYFFITGLILIHCEGYNSSTNWHYNTSDPELSFIPLEYVEQLEVISGSYSTFVDNKFETVKPSVTKGAVIGGLVAGTTGAVIGAAAASQSEGKTKLTLAHVEEHSTLNLNVQIKDSKLFQQRISFFIPIAQNIEINTRLRKLIDDVKSATDIESKKKLLAVNDKAHKKENYRNKIGLYVFGGGTIFIIILWFRLGFWNGMDPCLIGFSLLCLLSWKIMQP